MNMLIEFSGERSGAVMMFGSVAKQLLKMMEQSGNTEGAIRAPDVPMALQNLNDALESMPAQKTEDDDGESEISIHTRAVPLIDLLKECIADDSYLMWKPK